MTLIDKLEAARAAARKPKQMKPNAIQLANLRPGRVWLIDKAPRCIKVIKRLGRQCRNAAVRGATKCRKHGGLDQVPHHPANAKHVAHLQAKVDRQQHRNAFYHHTTECRTVVMQETARAGLKDKQWQLLNEGAHAWLKNDNGKEWRKWQKTLRKLTQA